MCVFYVYSHLSQRDTKPWLLNLAWAVAYPWHPKTLNYGASEAGEETDQEVEACAGQVVGIMTASQKLLHGGM